MYVNSKLAEGKRNASLSCWSNLSQAILFLNQDAWRTPVNSGHCEKPQLRVSSETVILKFSHGIRQLETVKFPMDKLVSDLFFKASRMGFPHVSITSTSGTSLLRNAACNTKTESISWVFSFYLVIQLLSNFSVLCFIFGILRWMDWSVLSIIYVSPLTQNLSPSMHELIFTILLWWSPKLWSGRLTARLKVKRC